MSTEKMFKNVGLQSYGEYKSLVEKGLRRIRRKAKSRQWLKVNREKLLSVVYVDFTVVHDKLASLYSPSKKGKRPYDPQVMLRSLLLMQAMGETSVTKWAQAVQCDNLYALICGLKGSKAPCVGAYYDFFKRLENGAYQPACKHIIRSTDVRKASLQELRMPKNKPADKEDYIKPPGGVVENLVSKTIELESQPPVRNLETFLNEILLEVAVKPSIACKVLSKIEALTAGADGSVLPSASSPAGIKECQCQYWQECDHNRRFSDPHAGFGWDNRHKCFIYGYRFFQMVANTDHHDLPLYVSIASAGTHEAMMAITAIDQFTKELSAFMPEAKLQRMAFDAFYDLMPFYKYLVHKGIRYAIPYKTEPAKCLTLGDPPQNFTSDGVPLCPGKLPMRAQGVDRQGRQVFCCPIKRLARRDGERIFVTHAHECPLAALCEPDSVMGPIVHVSSDINPRFHPIVPRSSPEYKELHNLRSCCERSNSAKKYTYHLAQARTRVMPYLHIRLMLASILEHSRVWVALHIEQQNTEHSSFLALFT